MQVVDKGRNMKPVQLTVWCNEEGWEIIKKWNKELKIKNCRVRFSRRAYRC